MKTKDLLFVLPIFLLSIFSCRKAEVPAPAEEKSVPLQSAAGIRAKAGIQGDEDAPNIHVRVWNEFGAAIFSKVSVIPAEDMSAPDFDARLINLNAVELEPVTDVYFTLMPGTNYVVKVIDTYGRTFFSAPFTADTYQQHHFFTVEGAPTVPKYIPPTPPTNPPPGDGDNTYPDVPGVTFPLTVRVSTNHTAGSPVAEISILPEGGGPPLQRKTLYSYDVNGQLKYATEKVFNIELNMHYVIQIRAENGITIQSGVMIAPQFSVLVHYTF